MIFPRIFIISLMVTAVSCDPQKTTESSAAHGEAPSTVEAPEYKEVWMMQGWVGYMGVMIGLKEIEYDYYFYSDVGVNDGRKPLTGSYSRSDAGISLRAPKEHAQAHLYSYEWRFVKEGDDVRLAAVRDLKTGRDSGRWLRKVNLNAFKKYYNPNNPFLLQMNPHLEQEFTGQSE